MAKRPAPAKPPRLERSSWVASIVSAVLAVVGLYFLFSPPTQDKAPATAGTQQGGSGNIQVANSPGATIVVGDCTVTSRTRSLDGATVTGTDVNCRKAPGAAIRATYYWLNPHAASFLVNGVFAPALDKVIGKQPTILRTATFTEYLELLSRFGTSLSDTYYTDGRVTTTLVKGHPNEVTPREIWGSYGLNQPAAALAGRKVLHWPDTIFLPDLPALTQVKYDSTWPAAYKTAFLSEKVFNGDPLHSTLIWRGLTPDDLDDYLGKLRAYRRDFMPKAKLMGLAAATQVDLVLRSKHGNISALIDEELWKNNAMLAVAGMKHMGAGAWPENWLTAVGQFDLGSPHLAFTGWQLTATVRQPYLQVLVLEHVGATNDPYKISAVNMLRSREVVLRPFEEVNGVPESLPFAPALLASGESIVVPLAIELRDATDNTYALPVRPEPLGSAVETKLRKLSPRDMVTGRRSDDFESLAPKRADSFTAAIDRRVEAARSRRYLFGSSYTPVDIEIEGQKLPIRPADRNNISMTASLEKGSCPILYVIDNKNQVRRRLGPIIVEAVGKKRMMSQEVPLTATVTEVQISEEEFEVSTLEEVSLIETDRSGRERHLWKNREPVVLELGQRLRIPVSRAPGTQVRLRVRGYYDPYSLASATSRP